VVGDRVNEEVVNQKGKAEAKTGAADGSLLSQKLILVGDGFHESPSDVVPHAGVVYESSTSEHLSKKHVAGKKKEDQGEVSFRSGLRAAIAAFDGKRYQYPCIEQSQNRQIACRSRGVSGSDIRN
jgi:hypothetical protein